MVHGRGPVLRHNFSPISPMEQLWNNFLQSDVLVMVKQSHHTVCYGRRKFECPSEYENMLGLWLGALRKAVPVWATIYLLGEEAPNQEKEQIWDIICFLLKGIFYMAHGISLKILDFELPTEFVLHAAAFGLPLCKKSKDIELEGMLINIFKVAFSMYGDQVDQACRVKGRHPLHIAAANKCSRVESNNLPSKKSNGPIKSLEAVIFDTIAKASPKIVASTKDGVGKYPFHIACASGHSWCHGLEALFLEAPREARSSRHPNPFLLWMAQGVSAPKSIEVEPPKKWKSCMRWSPFRKSRSKKAKEMTAGRESNQFVDELNTMFQFFRADPGIVLSLLR